MTFTFLRGEHVDFASEGLLVVAGTSALMFARWLIVNTALRPAAIKLMGLSFKELDGESRAGVEKFCKSGWHFVIYVISACWGVMILFESEWSVLRSGKFEQIWLGYPHPGSEKIILKAYFLAHISWYLHGIFESVMVDTSRTDFGLLVIHHFLAVALLVGAFWGNVHRATITMCILQEISDVVMHFSRIVHKSSAVPWLQGRLLHALLLRSFFAAWVGLRILPTSWVLLKLPSAAPTAGMFIPGRPDFDLLSGTLYVQLVMLLGMQVTWGLAIGRMCVDQWRTGRVVERHDARPGPGARKEL
mmetsp:Transcript_41636/g.111634  ORF Transcript_41636/g.111634 Transcript_41636/m.111634 type:complete len:303 (+) Transcript_41636:84-992(+)